MSARLLRTSLLPILLTAAAAASAQTASTVSIYGLVDLSMGRTQAPGGVATKGVDSGKMTTSYWGVKGTEDLGGGMSAQFTLESFMRNDTGGPGRFDGDALWARNAFVGLNTSAGQVTLGRNTTSLFVQTLLFNAVGDSFGYSPSIRHYFTSGTVSGDTGWNDSVKYLSPNFSGASFSAHAALSENNGGRNLGLSGMYFAGPLGLAAAWQKVEKGATVDNTTTWQLAGSYDLGVAKLFAQYGRVDNKSAPRVNDYAITGFGASVPMSSTGKLLVQYGEVDPDQGARLRTFTLGYDYFLSKRTDVYGAFMSDRKTGSGTGTSYGVGIRHRF